MPISDEADFPTPGRVNGRLYFDRHAVENFKRQLVGLGPVERNSREPITFIDATTVANELGVYRRTVSRLIAGRFSRRGRVTIWQAAANPVGLSSRHAGMSPATN
jgi:hypothetical protein